MSDENLQSGGLHNSEGFERQDLGARAVFGFLIGLAVVGILVYLVANGLYASLDRYQQAHEPAQNPLRPALERDTRDTQAAKVGQQVDQRFPEPRLEKDERNELTEFRQHEEERLNSYGWVDQQAGVVHIPIERAMQLVAERGLPVAPPAGSIPSASKQAKPAAKGQKR